MERILLLVLLAAIAASLYLGYAVGPALTLPGGAKAQPVVRTQEISLPTPAGTPAAGEAPSTPANGLVGSVSVKLFGIDERGEGQVADLTVELVKGEGKVFVALDPKTNPELQEETQASLKLAVEIARKYATLNTNTHDLRFTLTAPSQSVGGKSAGAAMTVATVALLTGTRLRGDAAITGGVDENERITRVGGVLPKAIAARKAGFKRFLVPQGEAFVYESVEQCDEKFVGNAFVKRCSAKSVPTSVAAQAGIEVIEASDVSQAFNEMAK